MALLILVGAAAAWAQPPLTTIQDTIYKADGTRMNATAVITWYSFEAGDHSAIGMQTISVPIVNGNLYVQLVPNTNAVPSQPYNVEYSSDGMIQFGETWMVPPSTSPLRIRDVRTGTTTGGAGGLTGGGGGVASGPVTEANVTGLLPDLSARPLKGSTYVPGRVAIVDPTGALDTISGNFNDCVYVNGTSGPCFDATQLPTYSDAETPAGVVDGSNGSFALATQPAPASSLLLFRNGMAQKPGFDYNLTGSQVTFVSGNSPQPGDTLVAWYRAASVAAGGAQARALVALPQLSTSSPQVICSTSGSQTSATILTKLGGCTIPANFLSVGDRVEVRFLFAHSGTLSGFTYSAGWGGVPALQRVAGTADTAINGKFEAAMAPGSTQIAGESYGSALPLATMLTTTTTPVTAPISISFQAALSTAGKDVVSLVNATVIRYPAISNP